MVIRFCLSCPFHRAKQKDMNEEISFCAKENCWSQFSRCLAGHALRQFLETESQAHLHGGIAAMEEPSITPKTQRTV